MHPAKLYGAAEFTRRPKALDTQRAEFIDRFPGLNPKIKAVFQK
jgi:hypothetical protein